jgi:uncharacterized protein YifN (PemK superfamily)
MMIDSKLLMSAVALCAAVSLNAEAKLFKWVDNNGTTHYGETIPPEYANKDAVKLEKGRIEKRDEKNAVAQKVVKDPMAEKARIEAERRDNALINTYASEKEIDLARDRNLQQVEARTGSFTTLLKSAQENQVALQKEAEGLTKQGRKIPKSLEEDLAEAQANVIKKQGELDNSLKESEAVKARYEADKIRYRELKGIVTPKK